MDASPFIQRQSTRDNPKIVMIPTPNPARFYVERPGPDADLSQQRIGQLLGNTVLLDRIGNEQNRIGSFWMVDSYQLGSILFKVLAVGPGGKVKHFFKPKKFKWNFLQPECAPGDVVVSRHFDNASQHPTWVQPRYLDTADGRGRVILDARFIECVVDNINRT